MHIKHLPCMCQSVPSSQAKRSLREETFIYNKRVTFYDIFVLWIFILEFRPVVTWYIFASNFLAMFVIRPSRYPEKHFNSFLLLYIGFYYAWKWLWKISIYTKRAFLTVIHIRTYACMHKKVFLALISLHLLYIKLKLESFLLFMHT